MVKKRWLGLSALCASILFAAPAPAAVTYTFTSGEGDFIYMSPTFVDGGDVPAALLESHSGNIDNVFFRPSDLYLLNQACLTKDNCFNPSFGESGIFQQTGDFFAVDPNYPDANPELVISGSPTPTPVPELSSWAMLGLGLAGLAFARRRAVRNIRAYG
jgi:MYXO-CTERM domain-containing protein